MSSESHLRPDNANGCHALPADDAQSRSQDLLDAVLAEQRRDWLAGKRITVSVWLGQHPELAAEPDCAAELIYHEFTLREELGLSPDWEEQLRRFPQHASALRLLRQADHLVQQTLGTSAESPAGPFRDYEVLEEIGRGGMGVVFRARQKSLDRIVALKVVRAWDADVEERKRFDREAQALARLQHPNIVQIYEVGEAAGRGFVSLEYVEGRSLARRLDGTPLPAAEAASLVETLARTMHYAHERGIIHRDLKPANILLVESEEKVKGGGWRVEREDEHRTPTPSHTPRSTLHPPRFTHHPKITDFGLAKRLDAKSDTQTGTILGTPCYMAPEQTVAQTAAPDRRTDIYGLGAILYELLTGRPPFRADTPIQTLKQVVEAEPARPRLLNPSVPPDLETVCLKCLEKEPARRYATADELADDLSRFCQGRPVVARPVSRPERLRRWALRNPLPATLAAGLALAVVAGLTTAVALWRNAERHLREEEIARRESEDQYLTCRRLLGDYVAMTRDPRLQNPAARHGQREALAKARAFCEGLALRRPDDAAVQRVLAEVCTGLAALDSHDGRLNEARQTGEMARALWEQVVAATPDTDCRDRFAGVLSTLGSVYRRLGRNAEATAYLRQALAIWNPLSEDGARSTSALLAACAARCELGGLMRELGRIQEETGMYVENCSRLERAMDVRGGSPEIRLELLRNLVHMGRLYVHFDNQVEAGRCWQRGHDLGRRLIDEMPDSGRAAYFLAVCGRELAARDKKAAPPEETVRLCEQAARLLEAQRLRDPADRDSAKELADICWILALSYTQADQRAQALRAARRAPAVLAELADRHPDDPVARLEVFQGLSRLAEHEELAGASAGALDSARQAADGLVAFCESHATDPQSLAMAGYFSSDMAINLRHAGAPDEAMRVVQCYLRTSERLVREYPDNPFYLVRLSDAWVQLGKANWSSKRYEQAEAALRTAARVTDNLAERWPYYRPLHEDRLRRLKRFLDEQTELAAAASSAAKK